MPIKFGTDGWRDVIAEDYTFDNVARVSLASARYFKTQPRIKAGIFIGYDARFLSREFAELSARVEAETLMGRALGATGTPAFLINGQMLLGAYPFEVFQKGLDTMLSPPPPQSPAQPRK